MLVPFLFWVLIYIICSNSYTFTNITDIFFGNSGTLGVTFWFVWMIMLMYIGIFAINKIIRFTSEYAIYVLTALSLAYFLIVYMGFSPYPIKIVYFATFITYIIIGYFIAHNDFVGSRINGKLLATITLAVSLLLYLYYIFCFVVPRSQNSQTFVSLGYFTPLLLMLSVNIFIFFKYCDKTGHMDRIKNGMTGEIITLISRYSFGIYLIHYLPIDIIKVHVLAYLPHFNSFVGIILLTIVTLIISLGILYVMDKIPLLNRFSGTH